ncbi:retrovirus-related pol polyprotein from transposon TNT 1-94 [Tanacetum coccineum]
MHGAVMAKDKVGKTKDETCLVAQTPDEICLGVNLEPYEWIKDSGYSKHMTGKTPYELLRGRKPNLNYFRVFRSKCFVLNTKDYLTKFDPKSYEGVFLGYSQNSKAYIILNKQTMKVEESLNVTFDETPPPPKTSPLEDDELVEEEAIEVSKTKPIGNDLEDISLENDQIVNIKESKTHPLENVIVHGALITKIVLNQQRIEKSLPNRLLGLGHVLMPIKHGELMTICCVVRLITFLSLLASQSSSRVDNKLHPLSI